MPCCRVPIHQSVKAGVSKLLRSYGNFVGRYPIVFIIAPIVVFGVLGAGISRLTVEEDAGVLYYPRDNQAEKDSQQLEQLYFPQFSSTDYSDFSVLYPPLETTLIFKVKDSGRSLFDDDVAQEINRVLNDIDFYYTVDFNLNPVCVKYNGTCVERGRQLIRDSFRNQVKAGSVTYPKWLDPSDNRLKDLSENLAEVVVNETTEVIVSARVLLVRYLWVTSGVYYYRDFISIMEGLSLNYVEVYYSKSESLIDELSRAVKGDTMLFVGTILLIVAYACVATVGGDIVSTRALLAVAGVLATTLGIAGAVGFLSFINQDFAMINFVMPFLLIGIGVDDMFLLMSSWSETLDQTELEIPDRVSMTMTFAGVGMTVTSLTDFLAFMIGYSSVFFSVRSFCLYAGVAVLFVYVSHLTFFSACLSLHGRRVYGGRHCFTCRTAKPRSVLQDEGRSLVYRYLCGGEPPRQPRDDESLCEKLPRLLIPWVIKLPFVRYIVPVLFAAILGVSIFGAVNIDQGLSYKELVLRSSYYYDFITTKNHYFPDRIAIGFYIMDSPNYADSRVQQQVKDLMTAARQDGDIQSDVEHCWLTAFLNSTFHQNVSLTTELYFFLQQNPVYYADIYVDPNNGSRIIASRCSVMSYGLYKQYDQAYLMVRMRDLAENSPLSVLVFQKDFELFEQYLATLPATLKTVGFAVVAIVVVCILLLPHPFMVVLTTLNIIMIICNIFGFMYFWGITLSSITMIHLVMSVGFSVDFSAHVCSAYLMSDSATRKERAYDAITHAASPIMNGGMSTLVGVLLLSTSEAYIFTTFFKVILLVMIFGILNSVVFLPSMLTLFGPEQRTSQGGGEQPMQGKDGISGAVTSNGAVPESLGRTDDTVRKPEDLRVKVVHPGNKVHSPPDDDHEGDSESQAAKEKDKRWASKKMTSSGSPAVNGTGTKKSDSADNPGKKQNVKHGSPNRVTPSP